MTYKERVEGIVHLVGCAVGNLDPKKDDYIDNIEELENEATQEILHLIEEAEREARIDELERFAQTMNKVRVDDGFTPIEYSAIRVRLAELKDK